MKKLLESGFITTHEDFFMKQNEEVVPSITTTPKIMRL